MLNKAELAAYNEDAPSWSSSECNKRIFECALGFASLHGYVAPRERCPISVIVSKKYINEILQQVYTKPPEELIQCALNTGHEGKCFVIPK
jgi:hypothetical protein